MMRNFLLLLSSVVMLVGCSGGDGADDGSTGGNAENPSAGNHGNGTDTGPTDGGNNSNGDTNNGNDTNGNGTNGDGSDPVQPPKIVEPTEDEAEQRAQAQKMDIPALIDAFSDPEMSDVASEELVNRGAEAVPPLIDALDHNDETIRQRAIFTLGQLGPAARDALPRLKELAETGDTEVVQDSAKFAIDAIEGE